jgi:hypothetical protein
MRVNEVRAKYPDKGNESSERKGVPAGPHAHAPKRYAGMRGFLTKQAIGLAHNKDAVPALAEGFRLKEYALFLAAQTWRGLCMKNVK